jgi:hypothetical protein
MKASGASRKHHKLLEKKIKEVKNTLDLKP